MVGALLEHRRFIWARAVAELRHRYAGTTLGVFWNILHPLAAIGIYSLIFGVLRDRIVPDLEVPYAIYLCIGLLPWLAFCEAVNGGAKSLRRNATYLKRLAVPEQAFVAQTAVTATLSLGVALILLFIVSIIAGTVSRGAGCSSPLRSSS